MCEKNWYNCSPIRHGQLVDESTHVSKVELRVTIKFKMYRQ